MNNNFTTKIITVAQYMAEHKGILTAVGASTLTVLGMASEAQAQIFNPAVKNPFSYTPISGYAFPAFGDLDGDGDIDLMVSGNNGDLTYYKNKGTLTTPSFDVPVLNSFGYVSDSANIMPIALVDIDNDGDLDLFGGKFDDNTYESEFLFYRNIGTASNPSFATVQRNPFGLSSTSAYLVLPHFADIDGDGDQDFFTLDFINSQIKYRQNTGTATSPVFGPEQVNPFGITPAANIVTLSFGDIDADGDLDLLTGAYSTSVAAGTHFYPNNGSVTNPQFGAAVSNYSGLTSVPSNVALVALVDIDKDGDADVFIGDGEDVGGTYVGDIYYHRNTTRFPTSVYTETNNSVLLFPNPTKNVFALSDKRLANLEKVVVEIRDAQGKLVMYKYIASPSETINLNLDANLSTGSYTVRLLGKNFVSLNVLNIE